MKRMLKKSKGFTLVELLIVVVIIGILAGMMMLSTGGATAKAEATKIVSDMRNMKAAAVMVYADGSEWPKKIGELGPYLDGKVASTSADTQLIGKATYTLVEADPHLSIQATVTDGEISKALNKLVSSDVLVSSTDKVYQMRIK
ncbi:MAG: prepilin-type N-terminal cleavage/methylation domain-containing protein [Synergistaceae bacterium]|nr:prepilin-type N-terminal cleavage/methylation domain-containing protein [Synergistaceae bacterium]